MATDKASHSPLDTAPQRPYRLGRIASWGSIVFGISLCIFVLVTFVRLGPGKFLQGEAYETHVFELLIAGFFITMGRGLLTKRTYGIVMIVIVAVMSLIIAVFQLIAPTEGPEERPVAIGLAVFGVSSLYYYLRRFREFR
jgi:uncharacterized membrane protein (UPF0136 family)